MTWWIVIGVLAILIIAFALMSFAVPKLSKEHESFVSKLHPSVQNRFRKFIKAIERSGWKVQIYSCHRGWDKSLYLWQTLPEVQACCSPGRDYHYMGLACDLVMHGPNGERLGNNSSRAEWENSGIPKIAEKYNLQWGGQPGFSYWDPVHFAYPQYTMDSLVERVVETCGSLEGDCGNTISHRGLTKRTW